MEIKSKSDLKKYIKETICNSVGMDPEKTIFTSKTTLFDIGYDSLEYLELITQIEHDLGIKFRDELLRQSELTIDNLTDLIFYYTP